MCRLALAGIVASLLVAMPVFAAECARPPEPLIPDPATAREGQMLMAEHAVKFYFEAMTRYSQCLAAASTNATAEAGQVDLRWKKAVADYNARVGQ